MKMIEELAVDVATAKVVIRTSPKVVRDGYLIMNYNGRKQYHSSEVKVVVVLLEK